MRETPKQKMERLERTVAERNETIKALNKENRQLERQNEKIRKQMDSLSAQYLETRQSELEEFQKEREQSKQEIEELTKSLKSLEKRLYDYDQIYDIRWDEKCISKLVQFHAGCELSISGEYFFNPNDLIIKINPRDGKWLLATDPYQIICRLKNHPETCAKYEAALKRVEEFKKAHLKEGERPINNPELMKLVDKEGRELFKEYVGYFYGFGW